MLLRLLQDLRLLLGRQTTADSTGLLRAEIQRKVLLVLVEESELRSLLEVDDGQDTRDRLAEVVDSVQLSPGGSNLLNAQLAELRLELAERLQQVLLALAPESTSLDLRGRHLRWQGFWRPTFASAGR